MAQLVLLPGLAGDEMMWREQIDALQWWRPRVADTHMHEDTITGMAAALLARYSGPLVLCGASMGGMIAMEAVRLEPDRVRGLALLGTTARPEHPNMRKLREDAIRLFEAGRMHEVIAPNAAFAFHPTQAANPALVQAYLDFVHRAGAQQLIRQNRAVIERPDARLHLPQVACPTLVMCGDCDQLTPFDNSHEIAALVPHAELRLIPACGHMLTMEKPEVVNAELARWLASVSS
jgi:pimeloyl-ACP methyl ester carboxylesterase